MLLADGSPGVLRESGGTLPLVLDCEQPLEAHALARLA